MTHNYIANIEEFRKQKEAEKCEKCNNCPHKKKSNAYDSLYIKIADVLLDTPNT